MISLISANDLVSTFMANTCNTESVSQGMSLKHKARNSEYAKYKEEVKGMLQTL